MKPCNLQQHYDIAIVGGGMVGASFALSLAQLNDSRPLQILLIETQALEQEEDSSDEFEARTTALSYGSRKVYEALGLWQNIAPAAVPITQIHVSDRGRFGSTRINATELAVDALGYVVGNRTLGKVLHKALAGCAGVEFLCPATVNFLAPLADGMQLTLQLNNSAEFATLTTSLLVLADGGKSDLCRQLGIGRTVTNYQQKALISTIAFSDPHQHIAYERFTETGPLAVLPLSSQQGENRGSLIWTLPQEQAEAVLAMPDDVFLSRLQERFGSRLGKFVRTGTRSVFPLSLSVANEQIRPTLVLLGNVAHTLHPVAGQGFNLAMRDAQALAQTLLAAISRGESPGAMSVLQEYLHTQKSDQSNTINFSHYAMQIFSSNNPALVWGRKFGLCSIDLVPPLKAGFTQHAMGMADRNQRLH